MVNFVIVTHGEFGAYLVEAAENIVGRQAEGVVVVSVSARLSVEEVRRRIETALADLREGDGGVIVATDIPGGTPSNVALTVAKDMAGVSVISGLNLYMVVTAFSHRKTMTAAEMTDKMLADGARSIKDIKAVLLSLKKPGAPK